MKLTFVLTCVLCTLLLASAGKRKLKPWKRIYNALKDIPRDVDLVHVIESSSNVGWFRFQMGLQFAWTTTTELDKWRPIAADKSRVALIRFSSPQSITTLFHLGEYNSVEDVQDQLINGVSYISDPGVAIGNALKKAKMEFKGHSNGDVEPKNNKVVWLYSSGNQNVGVNPIQEAKILKENYKAKICVIPIGYFDNEEEELLRKIASPNCYIPDIKSAKSYRKAFKKAIKKLKFRLKKNKKPHRGPSKKKRIVN